MRRRSSLTATFAVVSLVAMALLGLVLTLVIGELLRQQALDQAVRTATAYADAGVRDRVTDREWEAEQLDGRSIDRLGVNLHPDSTLLEVRLWGKSGKPLYDSVDLAHPFPDLARLNAAIGEGQPSAALVTQVDRRTGTGSGLDPTVMPGVETVLDVYVPVYTVPDVPIAYGVAEIALDYSATEAATAGAVRTVALVVGIGLLVVWLLLFRTVHGASRKLRTTSDENARLALLDPLTGLPNRRLLGERLELAAAEAKLNGNHVGLLLLDVDRFKEINDSLGHDRGDQLLVQVAERLRTITRETDTVARLGGDEFAVLLKTVRSVEDATMFADRVLGVFSEPYDIDGLVLHVETSLGLALLPDHADDVQTLMKRADVAMYVAKAGRRGMSVYEADGDVNSPARLILLGDLRRALDDRDQLSVHYQPKLDLRSGEVVGLEALLRWNHPVRGNVPPGDFIPLAEQTGLVHLLTRRVLEMVLEQIRAWRVDGWEIQVAVNLSAMNLAEPDLDKHIAELLAEYDVPARLVEFEITESAIVADPERAAATLSRIAAMGSTIALDDFGIGNTSISQLRDLPIDTLKIDRSFILDMSNGNEVLVKVVTELAHEFQMVAVAEGVEEHGVAERLRDLGCDLAQGFLYARPVPAHELPAIFAAYGTDPREARLGV
ncbi:MAG TPA: EAL domain-containing protein [Candidatus Nanopelagicales bacterium]|nr:EAL domain-containing protein [Candidatus Nanopelagicales bacterium]